MNNDGSISYRIREGELKPHEAVDLEATPLGYYGTDPCPYVVRLSLNEALSDWT